MHNNSAISVRRGFFAFLAALFLCLAAGPAQALSVGDLRVGQHPDKTRLVLELSEAAAFRTFVLDNPWRLVVDLPSFDWRVGNIGNPASSPVATVRQGPLKPGISRIVIDLKQPVSIRTAFIMRAEREKPDRLVIDVLPVSAAAYAREKGRVLGVLDADIPPAQARHQEPQTQPPAQEPSYAGMQAPPPRKPDTPSRPEREDGPRPVIVIDAGHGGADPGAIGANGIPEKNITLAMARELKKALEATGRYTVRLTRDRDTFIRLHKRVEIAHAHQGDLFISLHADTIGDSHVRGASIYTLSEKASDEQTARLADRENRADLIAGVDLSHEDEQVAGILVDLAMRDTMNQSNFFAGTVMEQLQGSGVRILEKPRRQAGFAVLKSPDIPSVLIELGFMSNRKEAEQLSRAEYRSQIARALVSGIDSYFEKVRRNQKT